MGFGDKPLKQTWGQTLTQPKASYQKGDIATAVFRSAHPKNNLRTEDSFLKVQRLDNGKWVDYLSDSDFDTTYTWQREGAAYSKAIIDWRIAKDTPAGTYRLSHIKATGRTVGRIKLSPMQAFLIVLACNNCFYSNSR